MLRTMSVTIAMALVAGAALMAGAAAAPARAADQCVDADPFLSFLRACAARQLTDPTAKQQIIAVIGDPNAEGHEAKLSASALDPSAALPPFAIATVTGATPAAKLASIIADAHLSHIDVIDIADSTLDLTDSQVNAAIITATAQGVVVVAAAGDTGLESGPQLHPSGVVNVSAVDLAKSLQTTSTYGPQIMMAAYGNDTATASGYVAAAAALVRSVKGRSQWTAKQVIAQLADSGHTIGSDATPPNVETGYGVIDVLNAVNNAQASSASLPGFDAYFPPAGGAPNPSGVLSTGQSQSATAAAQTTGKSGGSSQLLLIGVILLVLGGVFAFWKRRQEPEPAMPTSRDEWQPPQGPRHSGYSTPPE